MLQKVSKTTAALVAKEYEQNRGKIPVIEVNYVGKNKADIVADTITTIQPKMSPKEEAKEVLNSFQDGRIKAPSDLNIIWDKAAEEAKRQDL